MEIGGHERPDLISQRALRILLSGHLLGQLYREARDDGLEFLSGARSGQLRRPLGRVAAELIEPFRPGCGLGLEDCPVGHLLHWHSIKDDAHYLNTIFFTPFAGNSTSPKSDSPLRLPAIPSMNSPVFPLVSVMVNTGSALSASGVTSICLMVSNFT